MIQAEYETKWNCVYLHFMIDREYEEDYQMPMLRQNDIAGVLRADGCAVEGKSRYTFEVGGLVSMKKMHEKAAMTKQTILDVVSGLLRTIESLQEYLLNPDCLLLEPEYVFYHEGQWKFCYLPGTEGNLGKSFHQLTEYFVKTLDYEDVDGIFLAYELHKATLQEHYDLRQIMEKYRQHETERKHAEEQRAEQRFGDAFRLTEEEQAEKERREKAKAEKEISEKENTVHEEEEESEEYIRYERHKKSPPTDVIREESGWWGSWRTAAQKIRSRRWGIWDDLIMESDDQKYTGAE